MENRFYIFVPNVCREALDTYKGFGLFVEERDGKIFEKLTSDIEINPEIIENGTLLETQYDVTKNTLVYLYNQQFFIGDAKALKNKLKKANLFFDKTEILFELELNSFILSPEKFYLFAKDSKSKLSLLFDEDFADNYIKLNAIYPLFIHNLFSIYKDNGFIFNEQCVDRITDLCTHFNIKIENIYNIFNFESNLKCFDRFEISFLANHPIDLHLHFKN